MNNKKIWVAVVVVAIIAIVGVFTPQGREVVRELGGNPGPEFLNHLVFKANVTNGGTVVATSSTATSYTLTSAELREDVSLLSWTVNVNTTLTTMASTSAPLVGLRAGESITMYFYNASTTAAATATFAAGTGVDLQADEGESVIVNGLEVARLTFLKKADTDVALWVEVGEVGD